MEIVELQLIFLCSLLAATLVFSLFPLLCLRRSRNVSLGAGARRLLSYLNCVAAGVFIAMCFLGLLPLVQRQLDDVMKSFDWHSDLPVGECIVVLGFFLVLSVEQICLSCCRSRSRSALGSSSSEFELRSGEDAESIRKLLDEDMDGGEQDILYELNSQHRNPVVAGNKSSLRGSPLKNGSTSSSPGRKRSCNRSSSSSGESSLHCRNLSALTSQKIGLRFFVLVLALSIHAAFEGLALGLVKDKSAALHLFVAMLLHESICAFALGVNLARRRLTMCASFVYIVLFSVTVPAGIGLGLILGETPALTRAATAGVLQGFAAGIFLHVTFIEVIPSEFADGRHGLLKVLFLFIGFLTIAAIKIGQEVDALDFV